MLLRKYLSDKNDRHADNLKSMCRLDDIPDKIKKKVFKLGELALEGALRQQITFKQLPDGCDDLGFMNVSTELYLGRTSCSFLHLTLQEFLAAFYVSRQLTVPEKKLLFMENTLIKKHKDRSHLDVLWRFMAGLTEFSDIGWKLVCKATTNPINKKNNVNFFTGRT